MSDEELEEVNANLNMKLWSNILVKGGNKMPSAIEMQLTKEMKEIREKLEKGGLTFAEEWNYTVEMCDKMEANSKLKARNREIRQIRSELKEVHNELKEKDNRLNEVHNELSEKDNKLNEVHNELNEILRKAIAESIKSGKSKEEIMSIFDCDEKLVEDVIKKSRKK